VLSERALELPFKLTDALSLVLIDLDLLPPIITRFSVTLLIFGYGCKSLNILFNGLPEI